MQDRKSNHEKPESSSGSEDDNHVVIIEKVGVNAFDYDDKKKKRKNNKNIFLNSSGDSLDEFGEQRCRIRLFKFCIKRNFKYRKTTLFLLIILFLLFAFAIWKDFILSKARLLKKTANVFKKNEIFTTKTSELNDINAKFETNPRWDFLKAGQQAGFPDELLMNTKEVINDAPLYELIVPKSRMISESLYEDDYQYLKKRFDNDKKNQNFIGFNPNKEPAVFVLYRTIGNDLPPRHSVGQTYSNVKFIVENEKPLKGVKKRWIVNRVVNRTEEKRILKLLEDYNQTYIHLPFILTEYAKISLDLDFSENDVYHQMYLKKPSSLTAKENAMILDRMFHYKNLYTMNNNGARNLMIEEGINEGAEWIFPFDGNCFFKEEAWDELTKELLKFGPEVKYVTIPMARIVNNSALLKEDYQLYAVEEPQIAFRRTSIERFNEKMRYGRRPKVEMLWRLKVPGSWDRWPKNTPWEHEDWKVSNDLPPNGVPSVGWVARLYSGKLTLEQKGQIRNRGLMRSEGIEKLLVHSDERLLRNYYKFNPKDRLVFYKEDVMHQLREVYKTEGKDKKLEKLISKLLNCAESALNKKVESVTDKLYLPPSNDKHDYFTPAPYFWPNPATADGLPYIKKDGERIAGTVLYDEHSNRYDRSRLASLFGNVTCLSLAWYFTNDPRFSRKAASFIETWFLTPETNMNPHLLYAQIRLGFNNNKGTSCIETKDFYYFLDAVRLVERSKALPSEKMRKLRNWFTAFVNFLTTSPQGREEFSAVNNHGMYYDLQVASIAAFLDDLPLFLNHTDRARMRMLEHFNEAGDMPHEMARKTHLHYIMFTLQGWLTLARLSDNTGINYWNYLPKKFSSGGLKNTPLLKTAAIRNIPYFNATWRNDQVVTENMERMLPLYYMVVTMYPELKELKGAKDFEQVKHIYDIEPLFDTHDGIAPFWNLAVASES